MECTYRTRAFRLLAEDARLTTRTTRVLHALITASPVALQGEPTMVSCVELIDAMLGDTAQAVATTEDALLDALEEVADA